MRPLLAASARSDGGRRAVRPLRKRGRRNGATGMTTLLRNRLIGIGAALAIFALDQWVKKLVTGPLGINAIGDYMEILPFFDLRFTQNFGVSLGMFSATSMEMRWLLVAVTAFIALVVFI